MAEWVYTGNIPIDKGHGVQHRARSREHTTHTSAALTNQAGDYIALWVYEVEAAFELAGSRAQSAGFRSFYPHNFVQPKLTVRGQTVNNFEYNKLSEFIRETQRKAVYYDTRGLDAPVIGFTIYKGGVNTARGTKGSHQQLDLDGFIPAFGRGARRFEFAHEFEFDFIVTRSVSGLMKDEAYKARKLKSWAEIVTKPDDKSFAQVGRTAFEDDPDGVPVSLPRPAVAPDGFGGMRPT
jgi:hypothetical protein